MTSRLRTVSAIRISFFSFQDIITSVTGILILVTLILTLYLDQSSASSSSTTPDPQRVQLAMALDELTTVTVQNTRRQRAIDAAQTESDTNRLALELEQLERRQTALAVELRLTQGRAAEAQAAQQVQADQLESLRRQLQELRQTNQTTQGRIQTVQSVTNAAFFILGTNAVTKQFVIVTASGTNLVCEQPGQPAARREWPAANAEVGFAELLNQLHPQTNALVFYVRPSGIGLFNRCRQTARDAAFDVGYDALEEDKRLLLGAPAAPSPPR